MIPAIGKAGPITALLEGRSTLSVGKVLVLRTEWIGREKGLQAKRMD